MHPSSLSSMNRNPGAGQMGSVPFVSDEADARVWELWLLLVVSSDSVCSG